MIQKKEIEKLPVLPVKAERKGGLIGRIRMAGDAIVMDVYEDLKRNKAGDAAATFRWVCDKKNFYTYSFAERSWTKQGMAVAAYGYWEYCPEVKIRVDQESQKTAEEFLKTENLYSHHKDAANRLYALEEHIREKKKERREELRNNRIEERQKAKKPLPRDWDRWLKSYVFKNERYIFYDSRKRTAGTCAYCGSGVKLSGKQKHNGYGKCPACGSRIQYKAEKKAGEIRNVKKAIYLQKTKEGFLTRYITAEKRSGRRGETYRSRETVLATWNGERIWYDYCVASGFTGEEGWDDRRPGEMSRWDGSGYLYTRNVKKVLEGTIFQYAPLCEWMRHEGKEIPFLGFMSEFEHSPFLEFFIKAGLYRLTKEYAEGYERWSGKTPEEILGINRQQLRRLIAMDGGKNALKWLRYEKESGKQIRDDLITWLEKEGIWVSGCEGILERAGSVARMVRYIKKQSVPADETLVLWRDYLRMAEHEGMDTTDDIVRFPKDLKARHDQLTEAINRRNAERQKREEKKKYVKLNAQIMENLPQAAKYYWEDETYRIIPAGTCEELVREGRELHHCVGSSEIYMERMAKGISWILFFRKKENPERAYYTIEIGMENDDIRQYYSEFDRQPDKKEIRKALDKFRRDIKRRGQQARIRMSAAAIA